MTNHKYAAIEPLTDTDAYKLDHRRQYPVGTTGVLSNFTNRGTRVARITHVVNFGLQAFLKSWVQDAWAPFWAAEEDEVARLYEEFTTEILGPNTIGSDHIRALHRLGYLPLKFRALPEGALVPLRVPSFTVENTHPDFAWLVNYIETPMSAAVWQPSTSATTANEFRKLLDEWALKTTGTTEGVQWQGHDFSFRGMGGIDAAAASGAGHALSFTGSDNLNVVNFVNKNYDGENGLIVGSVPATEHSVMCAGASDAPRDETGKIDEISTYEHILDMYPSGIVSVVSDTYDLWEVITSVLPRLKDRIMSRDGKIVIRPDSGDPVDILTGVQTDERDWAATERYDPTYEKKLGTPAAKGVIELLWDIFGGTVNEQGYKVLDPHIGAIYGDSITYDRAKAIMERLEAKGFASSNVVFGVGSYTYQYVTRDTFASAVKATWVEINGEGREIFKDPITDNGTKKSAKGRLAVLYQTDPATGEKDYVLVDGEIGAKLEGTDQDMLATVWQDGKFIKYFSFAEVRENLHPEGL
ncbi:nicotinate ribosyltransferase [Microbacterium phage Pumpernickel]|uniref:Nicotinamide phosphoribosyltransferase n=1 Tax=Microbacterium phage Pumpernickel TaxID=2885983 RepID=A0AAE9C2Y6_9CAUD|nr:nicotinate ribosyltransferase [Microbacterium phage Pumpernickel]UDL15961.1 nicotinate ribosyltransferase [Microbacterium phage Pumpernickel]